MLRGLMVPLTAVLLALPVAARAPKDYPAADAGYLVYAVGTVRIGMDFSFSYHRTATHDGAAVQDWKGKIEPKLGGAIYLKIKKPDFSGEETGHVVVRRLPPGRYQVDSFFFGGSVPGIGAYSFSPGKPFTLPFTIRSGEATYIGSFMRSPSLGTPLQPVLGAAGFFVVADRAGRDLPIAASRLPAAAKVNAEVTDVTRFETPVLRTSLP